MDGMSLKMAGSDTILLTEEEIEAGKSARGGWTRATLAAWGVPWPPPKGWKRKLLGQAEENSRILYVGGEEWLYEVAPWGRQLPPFDAADAVRIDNNAPAVRVTCGGEVIGLAICHDASLQRPVENILAKVMIEREGTPLAG